MLASRAEAGTWASEFGGVGAPAEADARHSDDAKGHEARFCAYALRYLAHHQTARRVFVALPPRVVSALPERCLPTGFLGRDLGVLLAMARRGGLPDSAVWRLSKRLSALYAQLAFGTRLVIGAARHACTSEEFIERARRVADVFTRKHSASLALLARKPAPKPDEAKQKGKTKARPPPRSTALRVSDDPLEAGRCEWSRQAKECALAVACEALCRDAALAASRLGCPISQPYCKLAAAHAGDGGHVCAREWVVQTE